MTIDEAYTLLYSVTLIILAVLIGIMLIRSIRGPRLTDRLLAVNMICTMVIAVILILCVLLQEQYLVDVALIYALISFVSVILFASVYIRRKTGDEKPAPGTAAALSGDEKSVPGTDPDPSGGQKEVR